jgi:ubiquinone/menaquinone biosynthesis C-methylase UbiE
MKNLIKKLIKTFMLDPVHSIKVFILRLFKIIDFPVPANSSMRKTTASGSIRRYFTSGMECYVPIVVMAEKYGLNLREGNLNILDFGCGVGRLLLQFTRNYRNNNYYACDIDDTSINFIKRNYKNVKSYANDHTPPLDYQDSSFDLIYSISIFSHLNLEDQDAWLAELSRVVNKDGYLFLTIEGSHSIKWWLAEAFNMNESDAQNKLKNEGFIFKEYDNWKKITKSSNIFRASSQLVGVKSAYGSMALSKCFINKNWNKYNLEVIDIIEGVVGTRQDLVILKKN